MSGPFENTRQLQREAVSITPLGNVSLVGGQSQTFQQLQLTGILGHLSNIQSLWLDASLAPTHVRALNLKTRQFARWPAGSFGWSPMLIGADATQIQLDTEDSATIALCVSSFPFYTTPAQLGVINGRLKSRRVDVTSNGANRTLLAANPLRAGYTIYNSSPTDIILVLENGDAVSSAANFTYFVPAASFMRGTYEYGGVVQGIGVATGTAIMTEFY